MLPGINSTLLNTSNFINQQGGDLSAIGQTPTYTSPTMQPANISGGPFQPPAYQGQAPNGQYWGYGGGYAQPNPNTFGPAQFSQPMPNAYGPFQQQMPNAYGPFPLAMQNPNAIPARSRLFRRFAGRAAAPPPPPAPKGRRLFRRFADRAATPQARGRRGRGFGRFSSPEENAMRAERMAEIEAMRREKAARRAARERRLVRNLATGSELHPERYTNRIQNLMNTYPGALD